jgi:(1->4)-alpha-D-glucan 1-alpha-D-glucosylmutase
MKKKPGSSVDEISRLAGIAERYVDLSGKVVETAAETKTAILEALGLSVATEAECRSSLEALTTLRGTLVERIVLVPAGSENTVEVRASEPFNWELRGEDGYEAKGSVKSVTGKGASNLSLPLLEAGYYTLHIRTANRSEQAFIIAEPERCWEPSSLGEGGKLWGLTTQVYSLRSRKDMGIGDYSAVAMLAERAGRNGAAFLGLSPLHALFTADRSRVSPYSPSSRLFLDPIYIDITSVDGFEGSRAQRRLLAEDMLRRARVLHSSSLVLHKDVWSFKEDLLRDIWEERGIEDEHGFQRFCNERGEALQAHAIYETMNEAGLGDLQWADRDAVDRFAQAHAERIRFHKWLQWIGDRQLEAAARAAEAGGMPVRLYRDLAVGSDGAGSEVWSSPGRYAPGLSVGAPPDPLGPQGQNWGLPPFNPLTLIKENLQGFRDLVVANMRHSGAIRIDHAFQLERLFVIPQGMESAKGAYLSFPLDALLAVLKVESQRHSCLVIAEDLGTGPEGFSDRIMSAGIFSYRVLPFEHDSSGALTAPENFPRAALAVSTTHDLPTFSGWMDGVDVDLREALGLFDVATARTERKARKREVVQLEERLRDHHLVTDGDAGPSFVNVARYLARTASSLVGIQVEDAIGERLQPNIPGPDVGYPNWRRRHAIDVESMTASGGAIWTMGTALEREGRGSARGPFPLAVRPPRATYRLQFHKDFTFADAAAIVPYLAKLGISHVYASPIQTARAGSTHGYDVVNHHAINPELGGEEAFKLLTNRLAEEGLGLILDIVPNHMGVGADDNSTWLSLIEWGKASPKAGFFDVDWSRERGKLVLPFLGEAYGKALQSGTLRLAFDAKTGELSVRHYEHRFPICPATYAVVLDVALALCQEADVRAAGTVVADGFRRLSDLPMEERAPAADALKVDLSKLAARHRQFLYAVEKAVAAFNGSAEDNQSFGLLHRLLEEQPYRLAHWRTASSDINYRRFFDITSLGGVRVEDPQVFADSHALIFRLIEEGRIQGLRVDHIDGLADPAGYCAALQQAVGPGFYIVVEKILGGAEPLRPWPIAGTSGYDALNQLDGVFVNAAASSRFDRIYRHFTGLQRSYGESLREAKADILKNSLASEFGVIVDALSAQAARSIENRDLNRETLATALSDVIVSFPIYRTYIGTSADKEDLAVMEEVIGAAKRITTLPDKTAFDFIAAILVETSYDPAVLDIRRRFQQLTGPVMAKSLEDTLFYRYVPLLSLNEVGGDPAHFGLSLEAFHAANESRLAHWPHAMIASATHDTKRGEDTRSRLNALSEMAEDWESALGQWRRLSVRLVDEAVGPDRNDQYLILQAILGAWPLDLLRGDISKADMTSFRERVQAFTTKALREAKRHTSWTNVNDAYEKAASTLIQKLLTSESAFIRSFRPLATRLAFAGMLGSLSRLVLKTSVPGVPDTYQGTEFWDTSFVDPDNRRPVDYMVRTRTMEDNAPPSLLLSEWHSGRIKQWVLSTMLHDRAGAAELYAAGSYERLAATGGFADRIIAFARRNGDAGRVVVVPRLTASIAPDAHPVGELWGDTQVDVPAGRYENIFDDRVITVADKGVLAAELFREVPFAVLAQKP